MDGPHDSRTTKHPVLRLLFPDTKTLECALLEFPPNGTRRSILKETLFRPGDSQGYRALLKRSFVAPSHTAAPYVERLRVAERDSHQDVVSKVAQSLRNSRSRNVLVEPRPDSNLTEVSTEEWVVLRNRIGAASMFRLLTNFFVFVWQPGARPLLQVAGFPINEMVKAKNSKQQAPGKKTSAAEKVKVTEPETAAEVPNEGSRKLKGSSKNCKKRSREPKWVREKKRKLESGRVDQATQQLPEDAMDVDSVARELPAQKTPKEKVEGREWKSLGGPPSQVVFLRSAIFYNEVGGRNLSFPKTHCFHELQDRHDRGAFLYACVFQSKKNRSDPAANAQAAFSRSNIPQRPAFINPKHKELVYLLKKSIDRFKKCRLGALLNFQCPLPWNKEGGNSEASYLTAELVNEWIPNGKVVDYLWAVLRKIFPPKLLGDHLNRKVLRKAVAKFVGLNRFDTMNLSQVLSGISTKGMEWLKPGKNGSCPVSLSKSHQRMLAHWMWWVFAEVIIPCLRCSFYCTESEARKQDVLYFRKQVWNKMRQEALSNLKSTLYEEVPASTALSILCQRDLGFAKVRFKPKKSTLRPIVQMGLSTKVAIPGVEYQCFHARKWTQPRTKKFLPVNFFLRNAHAVVKYECARQRNRVMASSTTDYDDVYNTLQPLLATWKAIREQGVRKFRPYIISCDVSRAFDNVDIDRLKGLVSPLFNSPNYQILKHGVVVASLTGLLTFYQRKAQPLSAQNSMFKNWEKSCGPETIALKQTNLEFCSQSQVKKDVMEHLGNNLMQIDDQWYRQKQGIPAGSILSPLFCSLFLADVEAEHLMPILEQKAKQQGNFTVQDHAMVRIVDDFLFITFSRRRATRLLQQLNSGIGDCLVNPEKSKLNFDATVDGKHFSTNTRTSQDGASFVPWCGLLINSDTLELQGDFSRYIGVKMKSTLSVPLWRSNPGRRLLTRLCMHVRIKCHPLLLDSTINSPTTVRVNIYQMLLLCAIKFHCYVASLPVLPRASMLMSCIHCTIKYLIHLIKHRMTRAQKALGGSSTLQTCSQGHTQWLGLKAFSWVLNKKKSKYTEVLKVLDAEMSTDFSRRMASQLKDAVDEKKSSIFAKMKI
ncbi:hypothetical protein BSKO_10336 [Bryopsis sp. KO-2023]|nr:hypothetical protein BSKO_10336 [Bryopsis sp. KO-2023]